MEGGSLPKIVVLGPKPQEEPQEAAGPSPVVMEASTSGEEKKGETCEKEIEEVELERTLPVEEKEVEEKTQQKAETVEPPPPAAQPVQEASPAEEGELLVEEEDEKKEKEPTDITQVNDSNDSKTEDTKSEKGKPEVEEKKETDQPLTKVNDSMVSRPEGEAVFEGDVPQTTQSSQAVAAATLPIAANVTQDKKVQSPGTSAQGNNVPQPTAGGEAQDQPQERPMNPPMPAMSPMNPNQNPFYTAQQLVSALPDTSNVGNIPLTIHNLAMSPIIQAQAVPFMMAHAPLPPHMLNTKPPKKTPEKSKEKGKSENSKKKSNKSVLTTKDAMSYLKDVKETFKDKRNIYENFLQVMKKFKKKELDTSGVVDRVSTLFKGHKDLLLGFNAFLPKGYEIKAEDINKRAAQRGKGSSQLSKKSKVSKEGPKAQRLTDAQIREENKEWKKKQPVEFNQAINYVNKIKVRFENDERVYKAFLEILNMYRKGKKGIYRVYEEVAVLFKDHTDLLREFTYFLPDSQPPPQVSAPNKRPATRKGLKEKGSKRPKTSQVSSSGKGLKGDDEDKKTKLSLASLSKELQFFERVKSRLRNKEAYQDFLKCLNLFSQEIISKMELQGLVYDIIGKYADLVQGFNEFLSRCESMDLDLNVKSILGKDGKALDAARTSVSSKDVQQKLKAISLREKYNTRPISDLDLTMCEQCTPSYRHLPSDYPKLSCRGRETHSNSKLREMFTSMLNVHWVSLPTGSEDAYGFKNLRRNQYEEALFQCEDDRFEMEMIIECNRSTIRVLEPVAKNIEEFTEEERKKMVFDDGLLSPLHLRSIEKLYGDHNQDILELLRRVPGYTIPIVLVRLKEKDAEWQHVQKEMNKVWRKVYEQNYHKSLDHRSFYFKQVDKKNLSSKGMITEIKELSEARRKKESITSNMSNATLQVEGKTPVDQIIKADITFEYNDKDIHDDIYNIIAYAADEMLSVDLSEKVTSFWRDFYEPFLGLSTRVVQKEEGEHKHKEGDTCMEDETDEDGKEKESKSKEGNGASDWNEDMDVDAKDDQKEGSSKHEDANDDEEMEEDDEDSNGNESDEEDSKAKFAHCKPVLVHSGVKVKSNATSVFYGNDAFYMMFRLHYYLYERLQASKQYATTVDNQWRPSQNNAEAVNESKSPTGEVDENAEDPNGQKIHEEYMSLLYRLIDGTTDASQYEDECRQLLGAKAYVLFTIDKLIYKLVKQIQSILTDDLLLKLISLYKYEKGRSQNLFDDAVYYANSSVLLNDETRFRVEAVESGKVGVQILENAVPHQFRVPAVTMEKGFSDYLHDYVDLDSSTCPYEIGKVFLARSLQGVRNVKDTDKDLPSKIKDFFISNGLECKIACSTSKVSYVLDTEDVLMKKGGYSRRSKSPQTSQKRREKFESWLQQSLTA